MKILGIDIGSVSIALAVIDDKGKVLDSSYLFHYGKIKDSLVAGLSGLGSKQVNTVGITSSSPDLVPGSFKYNNQMAEIKTAQLFHPYVRSILSVGGEKFSLTSFDKDSRYLKTKTNTSCAAGTGSFLDQQAQRLHLENISTLSKLAFSNLGTIPKIASRCSVFAKTDLIHAQQEGYKLEEICDGLCFGLAKNIVDTLIKTEGIIEPALMIGGVALNNAVVKHIEKLLGVNIITDAYSTLYGAIGSAICLGEELRTGEINTINIPDDLKIEERESRKYYYEPLGINKSDYPDFTSEESFIYKSEVSEYYLPVEVDIYENLNNSKWDNVSLGVDIGSTSTKAVLMAGEKVLAGFYTRTAGRPFNAVQSVFEATDSIVKSKNISLSTEAVATTGSGRKFIGKLIGADMVVDEITAHARAAREINPLVDTIIEIGGQDSKFTTLREGAVNFSTMNTVCAAGTGSFLEEQAQKLGRSVRDYSELALGKAAPIASDRCTVFMERDINYFLGQGFTPEEILATALHSVRDNYLSKVAVEANIGKHICFQGATAKNKALVAAFEQRIDQPISVSKYCHLTGAIGAALLVQENEVKRTAFRGYDLYKQQITIDTEVCELCSNNCKLNVAQIEGDTVAYGFLCGRDYDVNQYVNNNSSGFNLLAERKNIFKDSTLDGINEEITIGLPAALHVLEELPLWKRFFSKLGYKTISSEGYSDAVKSGKKLAGAEFCAPITALHGHVEYLADKADYIFLPFIYQERSKPQGYIRQYCYYTHYAPTVISIISELGIRKKSITPLLNFMLGDSYTVSQMYTALKIIGDKNITLSRVKRALKESIDYFEQKIDMLKELFIRTIEKENDIAVVLLGRPYTILSSHMNKGIPDIFAALGIKVFYQDMISYNSSELTDIEGLRELFHWKFAAQILEVTEVLCRKKGIYPVYITSFKCSPDSFVMEYFKRICDSHEKPFLILQLDEHDSSVGYETRIESAIRSFRNHNSGNFSYTGRNHLPVNPEIIKGMKNKTVLVPNWDAITGTLLIANLKKYGHDARLLQEDSTTIQKSTRHNTGQCIPLNAIAQEYIDYMETHNCNPDDTVLWIMKSDLSCNIRLFPYYIKSILEKYGKGMEKAGVICSDITFHDTSYSMAIDMYFAYMFGGMLKKMGCRIRPYEVNKGETDRVVEKGLALLSEAFMGKRDREEALAEVIGIFSGIKVTNEKKPKVALFGDLYMRDNDVINQDLIRAIEDAGAEVITTPYSYYMKMLAPVYFKRWSNKKKYLDVLSGKGLYALTSFLEKKYYKYFERVLKEPNHDYSRIAVQSFNFVCEKFNMNLVHGGESLDNLIKIFNLLYFYPDISLFVQTSPAFCCPSLITEAMTKEIEKITGVPIVSITYDGTEGYKNDVIIPYIHYAKNTDNVQLESLFEYLMSAEKP